MVISVLKSKFEVDTRRCITPLHMAQCMQTAGQVKIRGCTAFSSRSTVSKHGSQCKEAPLHLWPLTRLCKSNVYKHGGATCKAKHGEQARSTARTARHPRPHSHSGLPQADGPVFGARSNEGVGGGVGHRVHATLCKRTQPWLVKDRTTTTCKKILYLPQRYISSKYFLALRFWVVLTSW